MNRWAGFFVVGFLGFFGVWLSSASSAEASHFRGGTVSYRVVSGRTVEFTVEAYIRANTSGGNGTFNFGDGKRYSMRPSYTRLPDGTRRYRITFRHTYAKNGTYTASWGSCCWISGISNRSGSWTHRVKVIISTPPNNPPVINSPVYFSSCTNVPFSIQLNASDPDKDKLTYKLSAAPRGMTLTQAGLLTWKTPIKGKSVFTVVVSDSKGAEAFREMLLEVGGTCQNRPPKIVVNPAAVTVRGGTQACTTVTASDPDVNKIQVVISPQKAGATKAPTSQANPQTWKYCWTPTLADAGQTHNILFTVLDNGSPILTAQALFKVTVTTGKPPVIAFNPTGTTKTVKENQSLTFTATASDPDKNGIKSFTLTGLPAFCTRTSPQPTQIAVTCKPSYNDGGKSFKLTYTAVDKDSTPRTSTVVVTLVVENVNRAPSLKGTTSYTVAEGQRLTFSLTAADPDGNKLTWTTAGLPQGANFTGTGNSRTFTWTPGYNQSGNYFMTVFVEDDGVPRQRAALSIRITVVERNLPPKITSTPPNSATEDQKYTYQAKATDPDAGDVLLWSLTSGPATAKVDPRTGLLTWTPDDNDVEKTLQFTLVVCDRGNLCATQRWSVKAKNINDRPKITTTPNPQVNEKKTYTYEPKAFDPDPNEVLTWTLKSAPAGATIDRSSGKITWKPGSAKEVTFEIEVCDKAKTCDKQTWKVKVSNTNDAPKITSVPPNVATEGKLYDYTPSAVDPDPADQPRLSWTLVRAPRAASFNRQTGRITWTPTKADVTTGSFEFEIQVCDPQNVCDNQRWTVKVKNVNDPPKITSKPTLLAYVGEKFTYAAKATDPDPSDILRWRIKRGPGSGSINPGTGVFTWTPNPADSNKGFAIEIEVCDNGSPRLCDTQKFNLLVRQKCLLDVNCPTGEICIPKEGLWLCEPSYCSDSKPCKSGQFCLLGRCKANPCASKRCAKGSVCRPTDGKCIQPCAGVTCSAGKRCVDGACVQDPCGSTPCRADEVCDTSNPKAPRCVRNPCTAGSCRGGRICSDIGRCSDNACSAMSCPSRTQRCFRGQCIDRLPCRVDVQCPDNGICVDGRCYPPGCNDKKNACPKGELCVKGQCVQPRCQGAGGCANNRICRPSTNTCFESCSNVNCPSGKRCVDGACVNDPCAGKKCPLGQSCRAGKCELIRCNGTNVCRYGRVCNPGINGCEDDLCKGVTCPGIKAICKFGQCIQPPQCKLDGDCVAPAVCVQGKCVVGSCTKNGDCQSNELCVDNQCVTNPCASVRCKDGKFCRGGKCVDSCASIFCKAGELCIDGKCTKDPCDNVQCAQTEVCVNGTCERSLCKERPGSQVRCRHGRLCNKDACFTNPCLGVVCPKGQTCNEGQCVGELPCSHDKDCPGKGVCFQKKCQSPDCYETPCPKGSLCVGGTCIDDKCKQATCNKGEVCRPVDGKCIKVCPLCKDGERCVDGRCETNPCDGVQCRANESCVEGKCVANRCKSADKLCKYNRSCQPDACQDDLCNGMQCGDGQSCVKGQCVQIQTPDREEVQDEVTSEPDTSKEPGVGDGGSKESSGSGDGGTGETPQPPGGGCDCQTTELPFLPGLFLLVFFFGIRRRSWN